MGSRWVSLACSTTYSIWERMPDHHLCRILTFIFLNCRYRVAEVEWLQDIPLREGSQERREVKSSCLFILLFNADNNYVQNASNILSVCPVEFITKNAHLTFAAYFLNQIEIQLYFYKLKNCSLLVYLPKLDEVDKWDIYSVSYHLIGYGTRVQDSFESVKMLCEAAHHLISTRSSPVWPKLSRPIRLVFAVAFESS